MTVPVGCVDGPKPVGPVERKTEFQPAFSIRFGQDQPFTGRLVVPTLIDLCRETERAVSAIRAAGEADAAGGFNHDRAS